MPSSWPPSNGSAHRPSSDTSKGVKAGRWTMDDWWQPLSSVVYCLSSIVSRREIMTKHQLGPLLAEGKTKIIYAHPDDPALAIMLHKDSISAGDGARRNTIDGKGALSGRTAAN